MFYLKQYDTPLLSFEIAEDSLEGQKCRIHEIDEAHAAMLHIGAADIDLPHDRRGSFRFAAYWYEEDG